MSDGDASRWGRDLSVLVDRNMSLLWSELGSLVVLLIQAPIIGGFIAAAWKDGASHRPHVLNFVLALVAVWFGCINACRELVKEKPIILREKRIGVPASAVVLSKFMVLALIAALQCLTLTLMLHAFVPEISLSRPTLFVFLWPAALTGTALGLLISALANSASTAVSLVPIVLIPQIIFSEVTLGERRPLQGFESLLPVSWCYEALKDMLDQNWRVGEVAPTLFVLPALTLVFLTLASLVIGWAREE